MKITRFVGWSSSPIEFELDEEELREAYDEYADLCEREDILSTYKCDEDDLPRISKEFNRALYKSEHYMEAYWAVLDRIAYENDLEKIEKED